MGRDLDGDHDPFPDTGETGILQVRVKNLGFGLTDAAFTLTSSDPNVDCIISPTVSAASVPANAEVTLGSLDSSAPQLFKFRASNALTTTNPAAPTKITLCLAVTANEALGTASPACFQLLADISAPGGTLPYITGPSGVPGGSDSGTLFESFDLDRDHDGKFTVNDTFLSTDTGTGATSHGFYLHGSASGVGTDVVAGTPCGGFISVAQGNPGCILDPDFPMDWHFHCPPSATNCPNTEPGGFAASGHPHDALDLLFAALVQNPHALGVHQAIWRALGQLHHPASLVDRYSELTRHAVFYLDPHVCMRCRYRSTELLWQCPHCHDWNTFVEERIAPAQDTAEVEA